MKLLLQPLEGALSSVVIIGRICPHERKTVCSPLWQSLPLLAGSRHSHHLPTTCLSLAVFTVCVWACTLFTEYYELVFRLTSSHLRVLLLTYRGIWHVIPQHTHTYVQTTPISAGSDRCEGSSLELNWIKDSFLLLSFIHSFFFLFFCSFAPGHDYCTSGSMRKCSRVCVRLCVCVCMHVCTHLSVCVCIFEPIAVGIVSIELSVIIQSTQNMKIISSFSYSSLNDRSINA